MNSSAAENLNEPTPATLEGLDDIYDLSPATALAHPANANGTAQATPGNSQATAQIDQEFCGTDDWLTVEQAAKKLSITANAVIKRLNKGKLAGTKVPGQWGEQWRVNPAGLPQEIHLHVTEDLPEHDSADTGTSNGTDKQFKDQAVTADSRAPQSDYTLTVNRLLEQFEQERAYSKSLNEKLEAANHRNGYLEAQVNHQEVQIKLLTDSQHKKSGWWGNFSAWLMGKKAT